MVAATAGGSAAGWMSGLLGRGLHQLGALGGTLLVVCIGLALLFGLRELGAVTLSVPERKWQIPASMVRGSALRGAAVWGAILGFGLLTYVRFPSLIVFHLALLSMNSPATALALGGLYGFSRAAAIALSGGVGARRAPGGEVAPRTLMRRTPLVQRLNGVVLVAVATLWFGLWCRSLLGS